MKRILNHNNPAKTNYYGAFNQDDPERSGNQQSIIRLDQNRGYTTQLGFMGDDAIQSHTLHTKHGTIPCS